MIRVEEWIPQALEQGAVMVNDEERQRVMADGEAQALENVICRPLGD